MSRYLSDPGSTHGAYTRNHHLAHTSQPQTNLQFVAGHIQVRQPREAFDEPWQLQQVV